MILTKIYKNKFLAIVKTFITKHYYLKNYKHNIYLIFKIIKCKFYYNF